MTATPSTSGDTSPSRQIAAIVSLLPHLWPRARPDLRARVVLAFGLLIAAKVSNVYVPLFMRKAVDLLSPGHGTVLAVPIGLILAYGLARVLNMAFGELRDAVFAKVGQRAIRLVALKTFRHLHALSLAFH